MTVTTTTATITVGVLALQGGFHEHLSLLAKAAATLSNPRVSFCFIQVRTPADLARCSALVIPGGESTTIANVANQSGLMEPLREFVRTFKKPVWGTCAGLILLSDAATGTKHGGQDLIGGLRVRVQRNHFGRQIASFTTALPLAFLSGTSAHDSAGPATFQAVFIRAPVVEAVLPPADQTSAEPVQVLARLPVRMPETTAGGKIGQQDGQKCGARDAGEQSRVWEMEEEEEKGRGKEQENGKEREAEEKHEQGLIVAVKQGNIVGMSFHPELTSDERIHTWWLQEVVKSVL